MINTRIFFGGVVLLASLVLQADISRAVGFDSSALYPDAPDYTTGEDQLLETLRSGEPRKKAVACKQLAIHGTKKAVPELAKLLGDKQLSSWARIALEAIPDPSADEALRKACDSLKGELLVGTINTIGVRRDAKAVDVLAKRLTDQDAEVASAAAVALGRIGNDAATKTLRAELKTAPAGVRSAVAEGCVYCAERLLSEGNAAEAAAAYDEVRAADVPKQRKIEATRGSIVSRGAAGVPLLVEQLKSPDKAMFQLGLKAARELKGEQVADLLAEQLGKLPAERAALLVIALGDREGEAIPAAVVASSRKAEQPVRIAAIAVLGRRGDAGQVAPLVLMAAETDQEISKAARAALSNLQGEKVNAALAERLANASGAELRALAEVAAERRIEATAALTKALSDADATVRKASIAALGATIAQSDLDVLINAALAPKHAEDAGAAWQALKVAAARMPIQEACAEELASAMNNASPAAKVQLVEILGAVRARKAIEAIEAAVVNGDDQIKDAGTRVLGEWMDVDAAPALLHIAKDASSSKFQVRALRGYLRFARQFPMEDAERAEMCEKALDAAKRPEERKLALEIAARYPSEKTLALALKAAQDPALKLEAARTVMAIAQARELEGAEVQELLAKVGLEPVKVEIVKAEYGSGETRRDVTETLRKRLHDLPLITLPKASYNKSFGGDPAPGAKKDLVVDYKINGKEGKAAFAENEAIMLPTPK